MSLIDIKIKEIFPNFEVNNFLIIENNTDKAIYRGFHAHKKADQLIIPIIGHYECASVNQAGTNGRSYYNVEEDQGYITYITHMTWAYQVYDPKSVCVILSTLPYDESDYIRDYREFLNYKEGGEAS